MPTKQVKIHSVAIAVALCSLALHGQQKSAAPSASGGREFPVTMRQKIEAGKTPVGTKVEAELALATLVEGTVIPRDAIFSGEVIESTAKTGTEPSRLAIRMDAVRWKKGSAPVKVYLTAWYYPIRAGMAQGVTYGPAGGTVSKTWNGMGAYPVPGSPASQPFPSADNQSSPGVTPDATASSISNHRVLIKDVESQRSDDGTIVITSSRFNIKLDKLTTYVLAADELQPPKESPKH
jgi:hypothetical protein